MNYKPNITTNRMIFNTKNNTTVKSSLKNNLESIELSLNQEVLAEIEAIHHEIQNPAP